MGYIDGKCGSTYGIDTDHGIGNSLKRESLIIPTDKLIFFRGVFQAPTRFEVFVSALAAQQKGIGKSYEAWD